MLNMTRTVGLLAMMFAALSLVACQTGQERDGAVETAADEVKPVHVLSHQHGQQSPLAFPSMQHIRTAEQFEALGLEGVEPASFDEQDMVLVALGNQSTGGHWVHVTGLQRVGNMVFVQATVNRPGPDATVTQAETQPYCIVITPKLGSVTLASDFTSVAGQDRPE